MNNAISPLAADFLISLAAELSAPVIESLSKKLRQALTAVDSASRVLRGGSWLLVQDFARAADRSLNPPASRFSVLGLRLVVRRPPSQDH